MATTITHLPTELLSKILKNVYTNSRLEFRDRTVQNASLTCRRFHILARPFVFRKFDVEYDNIGENDPGSSSRDIARLDFYSSDAISPFVREVELSISSTTGDPDDLMLQPEFTSIVAKIFDALPRFTNIRSFSCTGVHFTEFHLRQVSALSSLECLDITDCSAPPKTELLPLLRPLSFGCYGASDPDVMYRLGAHRWLVHLDPIRLQELCVHLTQDSSSLFISDAHPSLSVFPSLHTANFNIDEDMLQMLPMMLLKTPALRSLTLFPSYSRTPQFSFTVDAHTTCPVPYLEDYRGRHKLMPILGRAMGSSPAHLRRVFFENNDDEAGDPLGSFINSFKSCHPLQLRALTHIHISSLPSMNFKSLEVLQDMFPVLQVFNLHASEYRSLGVVHNVDLTDLYALPLPSTLESLSIQWRSNEDNEVVPDLIAAKDHLLPRLPSLRRLWLFDLSKLALLWSRTASRAEERSTLHEARSQDDVWKRDEVLHPEKFFFRR